jgi:hypothetical protein
MDRQCQKCHTASVTEDRQAFLDSEGRRRRFVCIAGHSWFEEQEARRPPATMSARRKGHQPYPFGYWR